MKSKIMILLLLTIGFTTSRAQPKIYRQGCDFLKDLHFKNGADIIIVLAYKGASVKPPPYDDALSILNKNKKLNKKDFKYMISFKPVDCSNNYIVQCSDTSDYAFNINSSSYNKIVQIRCVVFEGFVEFSHPYFVVENYALNKAPGLKITSRAPCLFR